MNADLRIRHNDDRLAHGVVKSAAIEQIEIAERTVRRLRKSANATKFALGCVSYFGQRICTLQPGSKLTGSRAKVDMVAFEPTQAGDYVALRIYWRGDRQPHVFVKMTRIIIDRHCVARYLQRTAGNGDVDAAVGALAPYFLAGLAHPYEEGRRIKVTGPAGQLRVTHEDGYAVAKTWISDRTAPAITVST